MKLNQGANTGYFPLSYTGLEDAKSIQAIKDSTTENTFLREYECQFLAPVEGAFFNDKLVELEKEDWFRISEYDRDLPTILASDIGVGKGLAAWLVRVPNPTQINIIDYYENYDDLGSLKDDIEDDGYTVDTIVLPHDGDRRQITSYKEVKNKDVFKQVFRNSMIKVMKKPSCKMTAIANANTNLHLLRFPRNTNNDTGIGLRKLKNYTRKKDKLTGQFLDSIDKSRGDDHAGDALEILMTGLDVRRGRVHKQYQYKQWRTEFRQGSITGFANKGSMFNNEILEDNFQHPSNLYREKSYANGLLR